MKKATLKAHQSITAVSYSLPVERLMRQIEIGRWRVRAGKKRCRGKRAVTGWHFMNTHTKKVHLSQPSLNQPKYTFVLKVNLKIHEMGAKGDRKLFYKKIHRNSSFVSMEQLLRITIRPNEWESSRFMWEILPPVLPSSQVDLHLGVFTAISSKLGQHCHNIPWISNCLCKTCILVGTIFLPPWVYRKLTW